MMAEQQHADRNISISSEELSKRCDICRVGATKETELYFGPWMRKGNIIVHYHCLLLSTNLPQEGGDSGGINGFLLRHIRVEITAASQRVCVYCNNVGASIQCKKCKIYFDLNCGLRNGCLSQFVGEFQSYCHQCIVLDKFQKKSKKHWKPYICFICKEMLARKYSPIEQLYGPCCKKGYAHRKCMQIYALKAGYYLRCIWCRSASFRESIKFQGIFVPDREANWETKSRYQDLHRSHSHCDEAHCKCPRGREYKTALWNLINCSLCGSFGAHYPQCIPKLKNGKIPSIDEYKCVTCASTEKNVLEKSIRQQETDNIAEYHDLYLCKSSIPINKVKEVASTTYEKDTLTEQDRCSSSSNTSTDVQFNCSIISECAVTSTTPEFLISNVNAKKLDKDNCVTVDTTSTETLSFIDVAQPNADSADIEEVEFFDFNEDFEYIGTCKLRINMKSPRFSNKTVGDIAQHPELFSESDIVERAGYIEPFKTVEHLLEGKKGHEFLLQHCPNIL